MKQTQKILAVFIVTFLLVGLYSVPQAEAQNRTMTLNLAGYNLKPAVNTSASGTLTLTVKNDSLRVEGSFSNLMAPYQSSGIYYALEDRAVNQLIRFKTDLNEAHTGGKLHPDENTFALSDALKELLNNGELSIRFSSNQHKQGEIGATIPGTSN